jgi:hypothetical protein
MGMSYRLILVTSLTALAALAALSARADEPPTQVSPAEAAAISCTLRAIRLEAALVQANERLAELQKATAPPPAASPSALDPPAKE